MKKVTTLNHFCPFCKKYTHSMRDHCESIMHLEKYEATHRRSSFYCFACRRNLDSKRNCLGHICSALHLENEIDTERHCQKGLLKIVKNELVGETYFCECCDEENMTLDQADQHFKTSKHFWNYKLKMEMKERIIFLKNFKKTKKYICSACSRIVGTELSDCVNHISKKSHILKLDLKRKEEQSNTDITTKKNNYGIKIFFCSLCCMEIGKKEENLFEHLKSKKHLENLSKKEKISVLSIDSALKNRIIVKKKNNMNTMIYKCLTCEIDLGKNEENVQIHLQKYHATKTASLQDNKKIEDSMTKKSDISVINKKEIIFKEEDFKKVDIPIAENLMVESKLISNMNVDYNNKRMKREECAILVSNYPLHYTKDQLQTLFFDVGEVLYVETLQNGKSVVYFSDPDGVENSLKRKDGISVEDGIIRVNMFRYRKNKYLDQLPDFLCIQLSNYPPNMVRDDVNHVFVSFSSSIKKIEKFRDFFRVHFFEEESVELALKMNLKVEIRGKRLQIDRKREENVSWKKNPQSNLKEKPYPKTRKIEKEKIVLKKQEKENLSHYEESSKKPESDEKDKVIQTLLLKFISLEKKIKIMEEEKNYLMRHFKILNSRVNNLEEENREFMLELSKLKKE